MNQNDELRESAGVFSAWARDAGDTERKLREENRNLIYILTVLVKRAGGEVHIPSPEIADVLLANQTLKINNHSHGKVDCEVLIVEGRMSTKDMKDGKPNQSKAGDAG